MIKKINEYIILTLHAFFERRCVNYFKKYYTKRSKNKENYLGRIYFNICSKLEFKTRNYGLPKNS